MLYREVEHTSITGMYNRSMPKLKCPVEGCNQTYTADDELDARIKLIAHVAAKHSTKPHA